MPGVTRSTRPNIRLLDELYNDFLQESHATYYAGIDYIKKERIPKPALDR
jgi:hypothetical protein